MTNSNNTLVQGHLSVFETNLSNKTEILTFLGDDGFEYYDVRMDKGSLSARPLRILQQQSIYLVSQLLDLTEKDLYAFQGSGKKTVDEILAFTKSFVFKKVSECSETLNSSKVNSIVSYERLCGENVPIEMLGLSGRSYNTLRRNKVDTLAQFQKLTEVQIESFSNIGAKSIAELLEKQKNLDIFLQIAQGEYEKTNESISDELQIQEEKLKDRILSIVQYIVGYLRCKTSTLYHEIKGVLIDYPNVDIDSFTNDKIDENCVTKIIYLPSFQEGVKETLYNTLKDYKWGCSRFQLEKKLPPMFMNHEFFGKILLSMIEERHIFINNDGLYELLYLTCIEFAKSLPKERESDIVLSKIYGQTLEEIGQRYNVTRERARQMIVKCFRKAMRLQEDRFKELFETYRFNLDSFVEITQEEESTYNYLTMRYDRGKISLEELRFDDKYPISLQKSAERLAYKDYVFLRGEYVIRKRPELIEYALRTYANEETDYELFEIQYSELLQTLDLHEDPLYIINGRGQESQISNSKFTLWKYGRKFRYYNFNAYDFSSLLETLSLSRYHNIELSTKKWFVDYPEIMEEYDIRDEYELHNLLKKIDFTEDFPEMSMGRMPNIKFGDSDRNKQALDLLFMHAPIGNLELAEIYEKEYGVLSHTALANYFTGLTQYLHEGMYRVDFLEIPHAIQNAFSTLLSDDFYTIDMIKTMYQKKFPDYDLKYINPRNLKQLGYRVYTDYVVKDTYSTAVEYFRGLLLSDDIVQFNKLPDGMKSILAFTSESYRLRAEYEIIEFAPYEYINIRKLKNAGIEKNDLKSYCRAIKQFIKVPFFTHFSLVKEGFSDPLHDLGFDGIFYSSVLLEDRVNFSAIRFGGGRIFKNGIGEFRFSDFIEWVIYQEETLYYDLDDLLQYLKEQYNITTEIHKLVEAAKISDLYYNQLTRKIYADYDVFLDTI